MILRIVKNTLANGDTTYAIQSTIDGRQWIHVDYYSSLEDARRAKERMEGLIVVKTEVVE